MPRPKPEDAASGRRSPDAVDAANPPDPPPATVEME
jgi:hypothetical protein